MKKLLVATLLCVGATMFGPAQAAQGDWLGRARVINISPDASSSALNIDVNSKITPELDFSYFVTSNFALELILATRKHEVTAGGAPVGTVKHLP
ncbi:MAG: OmpW family outer membrane protein, partial [Burkholderiales bacterium]